MGIDKSLSDAYPSVIINGSKYHYGKSPESGEYLVEHESCPLDSLSYRERQDLEAFLVNLPESLDGNLRLRLHPDWRAVSPEQREAYAEQDKLLFRAWAAEKVRNGTAQAFNMDLEGEHGPHEPQRIEARGSEPPAVRIERQIRELKSRAEFIETVDRFTAPPVHGFVDINQEERIIGDSWGQLSESRKLEQLDTLDWQGVTPLQRLCVIEGEVDLNRVSPAIERLYLGELRDQALQAIHGGQIPSLTAAILADPAAFVPDSGDGNQHGHNHGPDRVR
jgi:hypothetical protein